MTTPLPDCDIDALDIPSACRRVGLGRSFLYEAIRRGELRARKFGRSTRILRSDFEAWLQAAPSIAPTIGHDRAGPLAPITQQGIRPRVSR
jgi:excisionase family DNA binding protein